MEEKNVKNILNYYLEYEIYNIASSSQIKINSKTEFIIENIIDIEKVCNNIVKLKEIRITEKIEKFINKKVKNKSELVELINKELKELDQDASNQIQVSFRLESLIKEYSKFEIKEKILKSFINELCKIKRDNEFWLYAHNISYINKVVKKLPIFIFKCKYENNKVSFLDVNINQETLNTVLSVILNREMSDVVLEYKNKIYDFSKEINEIKDNKNIEDTLDIYYEKLNEYVGISKCQIKKISDNCSQYHFNEEYIMSLEELTDEGIRNIRDDIELLIKLIENNNYIPRLLKQYLKGSDKKKNINNDKYLHIYRGNYKSNFGVGQNQYRIVNSIKDNNLIAVEGPPGTGKTSLLKEIIANKIVERANLIIKNWDTELEERNYYSTSYYSMKWFEEDKNVVKSIVVSSKNGEAIENVGQEINQEIKYMFPIARKYRRTQTVNGYKQRKLQDYKGIICLPLGKQDNIQDFKEFLYQKYIPMLNRLNSKEYSREIIEKIKMNYENKIKEIKQFEKLVSIFNLFTDYKKYFYEIKIPTEMKEKEKTIKSLLDKFLKDKQEKQKKKKCLNEQKDYLLIQKNNILKEIESISENIELKEQEIKDTQQNILNIANNIRNLKEEEQFFNKCKKNIFTKVLNYSEYRKYREIDFFSEIQKNEILKSTEEQEILYYIKDKNNLESKKDKIQLKYKDIEDRYKNIETVNQNLEEEIAEMELIDIFNQYDKNTYWHYDNVMDIYGKSSLNDLNQELFELALRLNEAYIVKNSEKIIENLKLFLTEDDLPYICSKFYDSTEIYNDEKQNGIKSLWNTIFLCFPVITTTLDSFCKRCFHLIPEYIDLELIDEAGQILPHNLVSAIYRAKKAVIVGDVNQIEPICNNVNRDFSECQKSIGKSFEDIKVESNSIQQLANKNTDILNDKGNIILNDHYRCESNIINFSNKNIYQNKLKMHRQDNMNKPFFNNMIALDVRGKKTKNENENKVEIASCIETIKYIREKDKNASVAVITPFKKQKNEIEKRIEAEGLKDIKVGTVHAFQGQEKDYIIFSPLIDSLELRWALNFIGEKCNMLNVAVTRAKKQFIYVGNLDVAMQAGNYITKLVKYIKNNGLIYSLYDLENVVDFEKWDERILEILQPELELENDNIGLYIQQNVKCGIMTDALQSYEFLRYAIKNTKKEIYIMSPWIRENVMNEEFFDDIRELKEKDCKIKVLFGYKGTNKNITDAKELAIEIKKNFALGYAKQEEVEKIISEMYKIIGKENFRYVPPIHAKILIIDNKYMCIGSHNWLSNAGKSNERERAKEGTKFTTSRATIEYAKQKFFDIKS